MAEAMFGFPTLREQDPRGLGGFRLVARIGEGGMGQVFLALSPGGQPAAVKVIRGEFARDAEFGHRFAREVAAAQKVRGAHLATLLDADPQAEQPWLATTYVAGPSLRDLVVGHGPLPAEQVLLLAWGIALALADIHAAKVVHRDLKPGNVMLDESGPKVIDFGIVKSLTQTATYRSESTRIGTPLYMSPEQALGRPVGPPSDVFALGATLYSLATGHEAFAAENEWAVAHRVIADAPDLSALRAPLRELIGACLRKDPDQRPTPEQIRIRCERELGDALRPGAWMTITGAREAILERTGALRRLTGTEPETGNARGAGGVPRENSRPPHDNATGITEQNPVPAGPAIAKRAGNTLITVVPLAMAAFGPFMSETWTVRKTGAHVSSVKESFSLQHPWQSISSGIAGVDSDWWYMSVGVFGTAACLVLALLSLLRWARDPDLRGWGRAARAICFCWLGSFALLSLPALWSTLFGPISDDNPVYSIHSVLSLGGWMLLLANAWLVYVLLGRPEENGSPRLMS